MFLDQVQKTIDVPVRVVAGQLELLYGIPLPQLRDGSIGRLGVYENAVISKSLVDWLQFERTVHILPPESRLFMSVNADRLPESLRQKVVWSSREHLGGDYRDSQAFVEVVVHAPVGLRFHGSKKPDLLDCECVIPVLREEPLSSLNHAYARVSEIFEPWRKSRGGNVFLKAYYETTGTTWALLDHLREEYISRFEARLRFGILCDLLPPWSLPRQIELDLHTLDKLTQFFATRWKALKVALINHATELALPSDREPANEQLHRAAALILNLPIHEWGKDDYLLSTCPSAFSDLLQVLNHRLNYADASSELENLPALGYVNNVLSDFFRSTTGQTTQDELIDLVRKLDAPKQAALLEIVRQCQPEMVNSAMPSATVAQNGSA